MTSDMGQALEGFDSAEVVSLSTQYEAAEGLGTNHFHEVIMTRDGVNGVSRKPSSLSASHVVAFLERKPLFTCF